MKVSSDHLEQIYGLTPRIYDRLCELNIMGLLWRRLTNQDQRKLITEILKRGGEGRNQR